jgi:Zn-dependent protease with chaperone function
MDAVRRDTRSVEVEDPQSRVDAVARQIFNGPSWTLPDPTVVVDPQVPRRLRAVATSRRGVLSIRVSPAVAREADEYLRGTLAHEGAHLLMPIRRGARISWPVAVAISCWVVAIVLCVEAVRQTSTGDISIWFAGAVAPALLAQRVIVIPSRRCEVAADRLASILTSTEVVVHTLQHLHQLTPAPVRAAAALGMDSHPSPKQRARRVMADGRYQ